MLTFGKFLSAALLIGLSVVPIAANAATETMMAPTPQPTMMVKQPMMGSAKEDFRMAMRKLWEDHIVYTRNYIVSELAGLPDTGAIADRLMKNQDEIGAAIKPYYGEEAGNKLAMLLRDHIKLATEVVKAAKADNQKALEKAQLEWGMNADAIATFLSGANPIWTKMELMDALHKHLELTTGEVTSRLKKDWKADTDYYDKGHAHMLMFADTLANGIIKHFPEKFM